MGIQMHPNVQYTIKYVILPVFFYICVGNARLGSGFGGFSETGCAKKQVVHTFSQARAGSGSRERGWDGWKCKEM